MQIFVYNFFDFIYSNKIMKKIIILITVLFLSSCGLQNNNWIENITNKQNLKLVWKTKWISFYQNNSWDLSIIDIDLNSAWISFWWVKINKISKFDKFDKFYASEFKYDFKTIKPYFIVNWQFFTNLKDNYTALNFPLKSNWVILTDYIDNNIPKKTFIIDEKWNAKILGWYKKDFLKNKNYKELIVAFSPEVKARENAEIWRTYIWLKSEKNVIFFIAKNKNQLQMNKIISDYWVKNDNIIMMDWWPSSQFAYLQNSNFLNKYKQYYGQWKVPQFFLIYYK